MKKFKSNKKKTIVILASIFFGIVLIVSAAIYYKTVFNPYGVKFLNFNNKEVNYGPYLVNINREYENNFESELISYAESIPSPNNIWWQDEFDNIKIAYYVCNDSINYYTDLVKQIESDHLYTGFNVKNAKTEYNATVEYFKNDSSYNTTKTDLIKVHLYLSYEHYVGPLNAIYFDHFRTVIMTHDKEILDIKGDNDLPGLGAA